MIRNGELRLKGRFNKRKVLGCRKEFGDNDFQWVADG